NGVVHLQLNALLHVGLKAGGSHFEGVGADWDAGDGVDTPRVAQYVMSLGGIHGCHLDLRATHFRTRGVDHAASHRSDGYRLGLKRWHFAQRYATQQETSNEDELSQVVRHGL